jgi:hypothetical protein
MKTFRTITTLLALSVAAMSAAASAGTKPAIKAPKVSAQAPKTKVSAQAPKAKVSTEAPKTKVSTQTAKKSEAGKTVGSSKKASTTTAPSSTTPTTTPATTPEPAQPNAISTKISGKADQLARVTAMLPQGMTLEQATAGFKNQGQFIATLNASKNHTLSFADLQKAVTVDGLSVGQAVKKVKATPAPAPAPATTPTTPAAPAGPGGASL